MAGAGYKLFNTGDVLTAAQVNTYLQEQTVMVFANSTARTTALSGVLAEGMVTYLKDTDTMEMYNGSSWVSIAADQTPLTTKGDLFTYSTQDARLGVGNNGETLLADSSTSTGLRWSPAPAVGNPVLNSAFQIWQRGTSFTMSTTAYTADRWQGYRTVAGGTVSRQATNDSTNLPNIQYCARVQRDSGNTNTSSALYFTQSFESVNSIPYAGKTVTLSFYARAGANYSPTSSALNVQYITGTGTDQNINGTYTGLAAPINTTVTLTTTWQRFSLTATLSSTMTEMGINFYLNPTGTAGANDYFEITGVQIDLGSTALPFRTFSSTLQGELAACQRYYYQTTDLTGGNATGLNYFFGINTNEATGRAQFPVEMRTAPTLTIYDGAGTAGNCYQLGTSTPISSPTVDRITAQAIHRITKTSAFSASTQYGFYVKASAEL